MSVIYSGDGSRRTGNSGSSSAAYGVLGQSYLKYIYIFYVIVMKGPKFSRLLKASVTDVAPGTSGPGRCLPLPRILAYGKPFLHRNLAPVLWSR